MERHQVDRPLRSAPHGRLPPARLSPELRDVAARCAELPDGLALLENGPLDCVAVTLAVHPRWVEQARDLLRTASGRAALLAEHARAAERRPAVPGATAAAATQPPSGPEDVVGRAEGRADGIQLLLCAPLETAAVIFGAHPDAVLAARALLARRGVVAEEPRPE